MLDRHKIIYRTLAHDDDDDAKKFSYLAKFKHSINYFQICIEFNFYILQQNHFVRVVSLKRDFRDHISS